MDRDQRSPHLDTPTGTPRDRVILRILTIADLAAGRIVPPRPVEAATLPKLIEELAPAVEVRAANHLGDGPRELSCRLTFRSLRDFAPAAIARAVPELARLVRLRERFAACRAGEADPASVRAELHELMPAAAAPASPPGRPPASTGSGLDGLFEKVDLPAGQRPAAAGAASLADILGAALAPGSGGDASERARLDGAVAELDRRLTRQAAALAASPGVAALESAWRGLAFLARHADTRGDVRLEVLAAPAADVLDAFYEHVFTEEYEGRSEVPLSLVLTDLELSRSADDMETLGTAARMAESLQVPFVAAASPAFWGMKQAALVASLPDLAGRMRGGDWAKWHAFRDQPEAGWVTLAFNRLLLRRPWTAEDVEAAAFAWQDDAAASPPVWGSAVWAVGALAARGFAASGLAFPMTGPDEPAVLEDLPLMPLPAGRGETTAAPVETLLASERSVDLADNGFAVLQAPANQDRAYFRWVPTARRPTRYTEREATRASYLAATLPYQLFAGAVSHALQAQARTLSGLDAEAAKERVRVTMLSLLATAEPHPASEEVEIEIEPNAEEPRLMDLTVRLQPRFKVEGGEVDLVVGTTLGG